MSMRNLLAKCRLSKKASILHILIWLNCYPFVTFLVSIFVVDWTEASQCCHLPATHQTAVPARGQCPDNLSLCYVSRIEMITTMSFTFHKSVRIVVSVGTAMHSLCESLHMMLPAVCAVSIKSYSSSLVCLLCAALQGRSHLLWTLETVCLPAVRPSRPLKPSQGEALTRWRGATATVLAWNASSNKSTHASVFSPVS